MVVFWCCGYRCDHLLVNDVLQTFEKMLNNIGQTTTQNLAIISFHNTNKHPKHYLDIAMEGRSAAKIMQKGKGHCYEHVI